MKKIILILLFSATLFAGVAEVSIIRGKAFVVRNDTKIALKKADELEQNDRIETKEFSKIQIVFKDKTIVTLGSGTTFSIDEYSNEKKREVTHLSVSRGIFKAISGKIGKIARDRFKIKTKSATIGIRGTYFAGNIQDDRETIGCLRGAIVVEHSGETIEVASGNMVEIKAGEAMHLKKLEMDKFQAKVSQKGKAVLKEIAKITLSTNLQFNKEDIRKIVNEITAIKDVDERRGLEDYLNNQLSDVFQKALLARNFIQSDVESIYTTGYSATSSAYVPLKWGYWSLEKPTKELDIKSAKTTLDGADAFQTYLVRSDNEVALTTSEDKIKSLIGYNTTEDEIYAHWDGNSQSRTFATYSGKVLAISDSNTFTSTPTFPDDYNMDYFSVIDPNAANDFKLYVDYGNRYWYGHMNFDIENAKTGEDETYSIYFISLGTSAVSATGLRQLIYFKGGDTPTLSTQTDVTKADYPVQTTFRYYGDNVEQIAGTFNLFKEDKSAVYGNMILNSDDVSSMQKVKVPADDTIFKWGYWAQNTPESSDLDSIVKANPKGAWIVPNGIDQTTEADINGLINAKAKAFYSAEVIGTVHDPLTALSEGKVDSAALIQDGRADFDFDFGSKTFSSQISFSDGSESWNTQLSNGVVDTKGFSANKVNIAEGGNVVDMQLDGKFYDKDAAYIGGGFEMIRGGNGKVAIGAFKGAKQ